MLANCILKLNLNEWFGDFEEKSKRFIVKGSRGSLNCKRKKRREFRPSQSCLVPKLFLPILWFLSIARHSRIDDIEMIDKNERQEITVQEAHHGWCHNEK